MVSAVIVAAGAGKRMGAGYNKVFMPLFGKTVLEQTAEVFLNCPEVDEVLIVMSKSEIESGKKLFENWHGIRFVCGGEMRADSVKNGVLAALGDYVLVHDGARPLIELPVIQRAIKEAKRHRAAAVGVICKDTIKRLDPDGMIRTTINREEVIQIQTPQVFLKTLLLDAYQKFPKERPTDECGYLERMGIPVKLVLGSYENLKLTTPEDLVIAEKILKRREAHENRTGI